MKHKKKKNRQVLNTTELSKYISLVRSAIEKIVNELGFHLVEVSFTNEHQTNYLRVTVMHEDHPISTDDCEIISRNVGKELDFSGSIPFSYILEVQSRGAVAVPASTRAERDEPLQNQNPRHEFVLEKIGLTVRS